MVNKTSELILQRKKEREQKKLRDSLHDYEFESFETGVGHTPANGPIEAEEACLDDSEDCDSATSEGRKHQRDRMNKKFQAAIRAKIYRGSQRIPVCHSITFRKDRYDAGPGIFSPARKG